jgi:hypothetical protein
MGIVTPSGTTLSGSSTCIEGGGFMDVKTLPATGTYTIPIDPVTTATGSSTLTLYLMPADAGGSLTIGASPLPISITTPGQVVALTLTGTSGQQVTVRMTGNTIGHTTVKLLRPDGSQQASVASASATFNMAAQTLASGTYTVVVDPTAANTGTINVQVTSP